MCEHQKNFSTILKSKIFWDDNFVVYSKPSIKIIYLVIDSQVCQKFRSDYYSNHKKK